MIVSAAFITISLAVAATLAIIVGIFGISELMSRIEWFKSEPAGKIKSAAYMACYLLAVALWNVIVFAGVFFLTRDEIVTLHTGAEFMVYMLGFMPGFAYLGGLPEALRLPRRASPRLKVPAGSVAVADALCAVYPWDSPGGWHLIGRTPVRFFDLDRDPPSLLAPGDRVRFRAVGAGEYGTAAPVLAEDGA